MVAHDLRQLWRELKDGRAHFNFRTRKAPNTTVRPKREYVAGIGGEREDCQVKRLSVFVY